MTSIKNGLRNRSAFTMASKTDDDDDDNGNHRDTSEPLLSPPSSQQTKLQQKPVKNHSQGEENGSVDSTGGPSLRKRKVVDYRETRLSRKNSKQTPGVTHPGREDDIDAVATEIPSIDDGAKKTSNGTTGAVATTANATPTQSVRAEVNVAVFCANHPQCPINGGKIMDTNRTSHKCDKCQNLLHGGACCDERFNGDDNAFRCYTCIDGNTLEDAKQREAAEILNGLQKNNTGPTTPKNGSVPKNGTQSVDSASTTTKTSQKKPPNSEAASAVSAPTETKTGKEPADPVSAVASSISPAKASSEESNNAGTEAKEADGADGNSRNGPIDMKPLGIIMAPAPAIELDEWIVKDRKLHGKLPDGTEVALNTGPFYAEEGEFVQCVDTLQMYQLATHKGSKPVRKQTKRHSGSAAKSVTQIKDAEVRRVANGAAARIEKWQSMSAYSNDQLKDNCPACDTFVVTRDEINPRPDERGVGMLLRKVVHYSFLVPTEFLALGKRKELGKWLVDVGRALQRDDPNTPKAGKAVELSVAYSNQAAHYLQSIYGAPKKKE